MVLPACAMWSQSSCDVSMLGCGVSLQHWRCGQLKEVRVYNYYLKLTVVRLDCVSGFRADPCTRAQLTVIWLERGSVCLGVRALLQWTWLP